MSKRAKPVKSANIEVTDRSEEQCRRLFQKGAITARVEEVYKARMKTIKDWCRKNNLKHMEEDHFGNFLLSVVEAYQAENRRRPPKEYLFKFRAAMTHQSHGELRGPNYEWVNKDMWSRAIRGAAYNSKQKEGTQVEEPRNPRRGAVDERLMSQLEKYVFDTEEAESAKHMWDIIMIMFHCCLRSQAVEEMTIGDTTWDCSNIRVPHKAANAKNGEESKKWVQVNEVNIQQAMRRIRDMKRPEKVKRGDERRG
jgi:hypothetical protein